MHICLLPYPLGIYKELYLRKDRGAQSISQVPDTDFKADECILRTTFSMFSVSPHILIWGIHKHVLESLFQNCVISNWNHPKNSETLR